MTDFQTEKQVLLWPNVDSDHKQTDRQELTDWEDKLREDIKIKFNNTFPLLLRTPC